MAGRGERFKNSGFDIPKPIIDVNGEPMIQAAVKSLDIEGNYIFIVYDYEKEEYNTSIKNAIHSCCKNPKVIKVNYTTNGPASSALLAKELINNNEPLVITNCDQIMKWNVEKFLEKTRGYGDGFVVTYKNNTPKNSYVRLDLEGHWAVEFAEKRVISEHSLNGIHFWKRGRLFVDSAEAMIKKDIRVNNEFYIAESYNQLVREGFYIDIHEIPREQHWAIGIPEDLKRYLEYNHEN